MRGRPRLVGTIAATAVALACAATAVWAGKPDAARSLSSAGPQAGPGVRFSPYLSVWAASRYDMAAAASRGTEEFTLAFVTADDGCTPQWDGGTALADRRLASRIAALRKAGGDVRVSFGGADGTELATVCSGARELAAAYGKVIDRYRLSKVDFDIEGDALADTAANSRRAQAVAQLQRTHRRLDVSFTLPAMPSGLTEPGTALLGEATARGVAVSAVNIMAMNYSHAHSGDMGRYAVEAATAAHGQIRRTLGLSDAAAWKTLAVTPMVGVNNVAGEVFTLDDATRLARFAADRGVSRLSMWSAERDRPCDAARKGKPDSHCSGVAQKPHAFAEALSR
ncbi:chitinase [Streptomyces sp. 8N706]|uniref:chitinase n=1 Tax=Streptomyces sp. 8N706 TaxID=3457416 RepID=UPI003FD53EE0